jgi:hypothetical protein
LKPNAKSFGEIPTSFVNSVSIERKIIWKTNQTWGLPYQDIFLVKKFTNPIYQKNI